jgi:nucleotidyltransferase/DNA polymerase involved in DNA repair
MEGRTLKQIRDELQRLMQEQAESLKAQTFGGLTEEELRQQDERLYRIRELSADFLSALKNQPPEE